MRSFQSFEILIIAIEFSFWNHIETLGSAQFNHYSPLPGEAIKPQTFVYERDILAEAQVSLKNAWKPMEADGGQILY